MSEGQRITYQQALKLAQGIVAMLQDHCQRIDPEKRL